jgi:hypothetical protein
MVPLLAALAASSGCDVRGLISKDYGPLAVTSDGGTNVSAAHGGTGILVIDEACAFLSTDDGRQVTLVFRDNQIEWASATREVRFEDPFVGPMVLADGATIEVGGAEVSMLGGGGLSPPTWRSRPAAACPAQLFEVHSINVVQLQE